MPSSWFSLSLPNPFNSDHHHHQTSPPHSPTATKPHFSLITQTINNVASFLAPPPQPSSSSTTPPQQQPHHDSGDASTSTSSIKNDLAEIGGSFNKAVTEISKFASNLFRFDDDEIIIEAVGITDAVVDFVQQISLRPECWIDFPLSLQHKDFNISEVQKDHASAIQELVPSLTTLRHKIESYMSEQHFWVIYFVLLLPQLNEDDYSLLSTPEIVEVREMLLQKLRNKKNTPTEFSDTENPREPEKGSQVNSNERIKNSGESSVNRMKTENNENCKLSEEHHEDDEVSFSDLEDEDNNDVSGRLSGIRQTQSSNLSSASESGDWIRLNETQGGERKARNSERCSESEGSSDWLTVEDVDL